MHPSTKRMQLSLAKQFSPGTTFLTGVSDGLFFSTFCILTHADSGCKSTSASPILSSELKVSLSNTSSLRTRGLESVIVRVSSSSQTGLRLLLITLVFATYAESKKGTKLL
eukprot:TRINITY_DN5270_c0_g1_i1.p1 TRINITY_DN5270_c0_g1~~TRINITY_DN5270_c0_g1_i1.p1  ORF type:complete len:111 (+),score=0.64 TRINITY_DN5270_c0_g1_i1:548-880(+)